MPAGRHPSGAALVDPLPGSEEAKLRLKLYLETLGGKKTIRAACEELGIHEAAFYKGRSRWLEEAVGILEPKPKGRPRKRTTADLEEFRALEAKIEGLEREIRTARVREELEMAAPGILRRAQKKTSRRRGRRRRGGRSAPGSSGSSEP